MTHQNNYAGIIKRIFAFIIDYILFAVFLYGVAHLLLPMLHTSSLVRSHIKDVGFIVRLMWSAFAFNILVIFLYFLLADGILATATAGKMLLKIRVQTLGGTPINFPTALVRTLYKIVPIILFIYLGETLVIHQTIAMLSHATYSPLPSQEWLGAGIVGITVIFYGMACWSRSKQAFHDRMAKTIVVNSEAPGLISIFFTWLGSLRKD